MRLVERIDPHEIRIDTTVGTRVYVGSTMIFGDLPWQDISHLLEIGWSGKIFVRRSTDQVVFRAEGLAAEPTAPTILLRAPLGLRPLVLSTNARWALASATIPAQFYRGQFVSSGSLSVIQLPKEPLYGDFSFPTSPQWLSTLP